MDEITLEREFISRDSSQRIWEFDLHPPPLKSGMVFRSSLVDRMESTEADVITVVAPAGYGKTTMLSQWVASQEVATAWLHLTKADNDLRNFLLRLDAACARASTDVPEDPSWVIGADFETPTSHEGLLLSALSRIDQSLVLVLDNAHAVRSGPSLDAIRDLVRRLEGRATVVISSRAEPKLPLAALRAGRRLMQLTESDLSLSPEEVGLLLESCEADSTFDANRLAMETDGWPAAISLVIETTKAPGDAWPVSGTHDQVLADFIKDEILPAMPRARRELLRALSPLERVSIPISEAVVGASQDPEVLSKIARSTHLLHLVEGPGSWYEMNRVLRRVLERELEDRDPDSAAAVHARAAGWFRTNDMPLEAIGHALKAGDKDVFVDLMGSLIKRRYVEGHVSDVLLWMDWLESNVVLADYPDLAAIGALVHLQEGGGLATERWLEAAGREPIDPDTGAVVWMVRAAMTTSGVAQMLADVETASSVAGPGSRWVPAILAVKGLAHLMNGEADAAEPCYVAAAEAGLENGSLSSAVLALGQRALIAISRQDWDLAAELSGAAMRIVDQHGQDGYQTTGPALIAAARCARRDNDIMATNTLLARASLVRPRLSAAFPGQSVLILLELAKAYVELSDVVGARALVREADDIIIQRPDLGILPSQLESFRGTLKSLGPGTVGLSALTKAELRLLPYLATNLSFPEIGTELFISRHTVKTQAMSIYRKLGTSSRSDAVAKAYELGLLQR
ncbi:MAG TPA: LuxR C-terminal-related transcriptional regulator [Acidimicrobiia bacterium]|nr:LuxR C-terminal-related transcriptional regulator [Acidimicrobiia bacterium]